ncbi:T-cell surface glycoprotein CD3 gamma chain-like isoform X4 [Mustelus asterias]
MKLYLLITVISMTIIFGEPVSAKVVINEEKGKISVKCEPDETLKQNGEEPENQTMQLTDPFSGQFSCVSSKVQGKEDMFVFLNMCKNCVTMDAAGISGILIASVTFTVLIAVAVYSVSAPDKVWSHQASDRHPLMRNEAADAVYSHLDNAGKSMYSELGRRR